METFGVFVRRVPILPKSGHKPPDYVTANIYEKSASGCNNTTAIQQELFSRFLASTYVEHVGMSATKPW